MPSKLDRFLDSIDPARNYNRNWAEASEGMNSFPINSPKITDWGEFNNLLARFFCHMENVMLRLNPHMKTDHGFHGGRCCHLLKKAYGDQADKATFEMARTGVEGGLYGVLKTVAQLMVEEYAENEIRARVGAFWNGLSLDEKLEVPTEYIKKHGHLLPSELTEGSAGRLRMNFLKVLEEHPRLLMNIQSVGR